MPKIITPIEITAPIELGLSRSIDFHACTQSHRIEAIKCALESDIWKSYLDQ